jgi:hypothetical protein
MGTGPHWLEWLLIVIGSISVEHFAPGNLPHHAAGCKRDNCAFCAEREEEKSSETSAQTPPEACKNEPKIRYKGHRDPHKELKFSKLQHSTGAAEQLLDMLEHSSTNGDFKRLTVFLSEAQGWTRGITAKRWPEITSK